MSHGRKQRRSVILIVLAAALMQFDAEAHAVPERAFPPIDGVVTDAPETLVIWFTEELVSEGVNIKVIGPEGTRVDLNDSAVDLFDPDRRSVQVGLLPNLGAGTFIVQWHSTSAFDNDPVDGSFRFTIDPLATPLSTTPTSTAIATLSETPVPSSTNSQTRGRFSGTFLGPFIIIGALVILVVWAGVRQRSRGRD